MESDEDDIYEPAEAVSAPEHPKQEVKMDDAEDGEEEGEEVEDDDSDDVRTQDRVYF